MAVFTDTRQLSQQRKHTPFKKVTGWKKAALAMFGYTDTGEKNMFGKYLGGSPGMTIGGNIISSGTDSNEVIKSQRGAEAEHQGNVLGFAKSIVTTFAGGGGGEAAGAVGGEAVGAVGGKAVGNTASSSTGLLSKAGTMGQGANGGPTKAGAFIKNTNIGQGGGKEGRMARREAKQNTMFSESEGGQRMQNEVTKNDKQNAIDELNSGNEALAQNKEGAAGFENSQSSNTNTANEIADATSSLEGIPYLGLLAEGAGLYAEKMAIADAHTAERRKIAARTTVGNDIRRA